MFSVNLQRICIIAVEKLSITRIFAQFDPLFGPLEAGYGLDDNKY